MLQHHEMRKGSYNEVVVDPTDWAADTLEAFYFVKKKPKKPDEKQKNGKLKADDDDFEGFARDVHKQFHAKYGAVLAPLVQLELEPENGRPAFVRVA